MESSQTDDATGIAQFAFEMGVLKRLRRAGWWHAGIRDPESVTGPDPLSITADQTACLPDLAAQTVREAVAEYEAQSTPEARCARDADKLECLIQAIEYQAAGNTNVQGWIDASRTGLTTAAALKIAAAALNTSTLAWRGR